MATVFAVDAKLTGDAGDLISSMEKSAKSVDGLQKDVNSATSSIGGDFDTATTKVEGGGARMSKAFGIAAVAAVAIGAAVIGAGKALYEVGNTFDAVSDTIRVGTGATGGALDDLVKSAKNVGNSVPADFEEVGTTVADVNTRMGLTGKTLETVASQYLEAGKMLGQTIDINKTSAAFSAFQIAGDDVSGALDNLFQTSQATGVGMNELAQMVAANAPAMKNLGFGFQETAALAGSLDKAGLDANQTLNAMSKGLVTLAKSGEEPQEAFRRVTGEINAMIESGDTAGAIDLASGIFGTRAASQFVGAVQQGTLALDDLVGMTGATSDTILGVAADTHDFAEQWKIFKNNALSALEPVGSAVFNVLGEGMKSAAGLLQKLQPGIASVMDKIAPIFEKLGGVIAELAPTILELWTNFSPFSILLDAIMPVLPQLSDAFMQIAGVLSSTLQSAMVALAPVVEKVAEFIGNLMVAIVPLISPILSLVSAILPLLDPLIQLATAILSPVIDLLDALLTPILALIAPLLDGLVPVLGWLADALGVVIGFVADFISWLAGGEEQTDAVTKAIASAFQWVFETIIEPIFTGFGRGIDAVVQIVSSGFGIVMDVVRNVGDVVGSVFGAIGEFISNAFTGALDVVKGAINTIISIINGAIDGLNSIKVEVPDWVPFIGGTTFGIDLPKLPMLADGGKITAPGLTWVGEAGPELVSLPRGASVVPLDHKVNFGNGGEGDTYHIELHFEIEGNPDPQEIADAVIEQVRFVLGGAS